mgnify:CR=1 FL=1
MEKRTHHGAWKEELAWCVSFQHLIPAVHCFIHHGALMKTFFLYRRGWFFLLFAGLLCIDSGLAVRIDLRKLTQPCGTPEQISRNDDRGDQKRKIHKTGQEQKDLHQNLNTEQECCGSHGKDCLVKPVGKRCAEGADGKLCDGGDDKADRRDLNHGNTDICTLQNFEAFCVSAGCIGSQRKKVDSVHQGGGKGCEDQQHTTGHQPHPAAHGHFQFFLILKFTHIQVLLFAPKAADGNDCRRNFVCILQTGHVL